MLNSVKCADHLAADFIEDIANSDIGAETLIVVMSDHLAMGNTATSQLEAGPRRNMFFIIDPSETAPKLVERASTTLDVGPTLLSSLGLDVPRMGFGVDLLGQEPTLPEYLDVAADSQADLNRHLLGFQAVYDRLWAYPDISDGLYVNLEKGEVQFGENAYGVPVVLTFDDEFAVTQATLGDSRAEETLTEAVIDLAPQARVLWFDDCRALELLSPERVKLRSADLCVAYGKRGTGLNVEPVDRSRFFASEDLKALLDPVGDEFLASFEQDRLEDIGVSRGELPFRFTFPALETGDKGVLVQSSAFGAGPSFIRRQTTPSLNSGEDWMQKRGITLSGLAANGQVAALSNVDQCSKAYSATEIDPWNDVLVETRDQFIAHIVTVHDTAHCGAANAVFKGPLKDIPLPKLKAAKMRQAYIGVIDGRGRIFEFPNEDFPKLRVHLDPIGGELPEFSMANVQVRPA
ncbi:MAG: sulfatase-like hydrolase/transferase, partial [Paracoccaceae bacterium]|nr:sulfatase-like hydrolase/transferase [Paracoccaceae bacterium]